MYEGLNTTNSSSGRQRGEKRAITAGTVLLYVSLGVDWPGHTLQVQANQVDGTWRADRKGERKPGREKHTYKHNCTTPLPGT